MTFKYRFLISINQFVSAGSPAMWVSEEMFWLIKPLMKAELRKRILLSIFQALISSHLLETLYETNGSGAGITNTHADP